MTRLLLAMLMSLPVVVIAQRVPMWSWVSGTNVPNDGGTAGAVGVPSQTNAPAARHGAGRWQDAGGNVWIFGGGRGGPAPGVLWNDLWKLNITTREWTLLRDLQGNNVFGIYGPLGEYSSTFFPGSRTNPFTWLDIDATGQVTGLYMFGGYGFGQKDNEWGTQATADYGFLADLWRFDLARGQWAFLRGERRPGRSGFQGVIGSIGSQDQALVAPGGRSEGISWRGPDGMLYFYGGRGLRSEHDEIWRYNPTTNTWNCRAGTELNKSILLRSYGPPGEFTAASQPRATAGGAGLVDNSGVMWMFGGDAGADGFTNEVWKYDPVKNLWAYVSGYSIKRAWEITGPSDFRLILGKYGRKGEPDPTNLPGVRSHHAATMDADGNLWIYGGRGYGLSGTSLAEAHFGDLWKFDRRTSQWTWESGSDIVGASVSYGTYREYDQATTPGDRVGCTLWTDQRNNLWLAMGRSDVAGSSSSSVYRNDVFIYDLNPPITNSPPVAVVAAGETIEIDLNITSQVVLDASPSYDPDGTIAGYAWEQVLGPAATLAGATLPQLTVSALAEGRYRFRLRVTDNRNATGFAEVSVNVARGPLNERPQVNAGADITLLLPLDRVTLAGAAVDDGPVTSWQWSKISGPAVTLPATNTPTLNLTSLTEGVYVFRLSATDAQGLGDFDDVMVTVLPATANVAPSVSAGDDVEITLPNNTVTLRGTASDNSAIQSTLWRQISGPAVVVSSPSNLILPLAGLAAGNYIFRLTATDDQGLSNFDEVTVTVLAASVNIPPRVSAGENILLSPGVTQTTLTGTATDNRAVAAVQWTKVSGPFATIARADQLSTTVTDLVEGTYVFRLTATDSDNLSAFDDVQVIVSATPVNQSPVVRAGADIVLALPQNQTTLQGTATDDGTIASTVWTKISGPAATIATPGQLTTTISGLTQGTYVFRLTATDNGNLTAFDDVQVVVSAEPVNAPPLVAAGADIAITLPQNQTTLQGTATDDGTIASTLWTKISGPAATIATPGQLTTTISGLTQGTYVFRLTATDNDGATAFDDVQVVVSAEPANAAPIVQAGADIEVTLPQSEATLTGSATDDGTIASWLWEKISGPAASITNASQASTTITGLTAGTYAFRLTVTDNLGLAGTDVVQVTVLPEPANIPPVVNAGVDQSIEMPLDQATLTATATDADGTIASVLWEQVAGAGANISDTDGLTTQVDGLAVGIYTFRITAIDNDGATAFDEVTVEVKPEPVVVRPLNILSPDNNNVGDTWTIEHAELLDACTISVYTRSGQKVYESTGYSTPWDGSFKGTPLPEGVYFYVIKCDGAKTQKGTVTLARYD